VSEQIQAAFRDWPVVEDEGENARYARICHEFKELRIQRIFEEEDRLQRLLDPALDDEESVSVEEFIAVCSELVNLKGVFDPWNTLDQCVRVFARTNAVGVDFSTLHRVGEDDGHATDHSISQLLSLAGFDQLPIREVGIIR